MRNTVALILFVFLFLSCSMRQEANVTSMCEKDSMSADGIVRLSKIEVYPQYLDEYIKYAVQDKENPCLVTILETYSSKDAYEKHIASDHFQKYKKGTLHMVKSLQLCDQTVLNPANKIVNYIDQ